MISIPVYKGREKLAKAIVYFGCLYFCGYYLERLISDRYSTFFELVKSEGNYPKVSICIPLKLKIDQQFCTGNLTIRERNEDKLANELLEGCKNYSNFLFYYNDNSTDKNPKEILNVANELELNKSFALLDYSKFDAYYLNSNHLCFKYKLIDSTEIIIVNNYR